MASPITNRSRVSVSDLAHEVDAEFRSHPKFQKKSAPFASGSLRFKSRPSDTPGPNAYAPVQTRSTKGAVLSLSANRPGARKPVTEAVYNVSVEPGASVPREGRSGSVSFASKSPRAFPLIKDGVDPTRYSPNIAPTVPSTRNIATAAFKSKSQRGVVRCSDGPSPTSYSVADPSRSSRVVSSSFRSRSPRSGTGRTSTPGPGQHFVATPFGSGRGASAAFKSNTSRMVLPRSDGPAPGAYEPQTIGSTRSYSIGKSQRRSARPSDTPGPGCYESIQRSSVGRAPVLKTSAPRVVTVRSSTPGPGAYHGGGYSGGYPSATAAFRSASSGLPRMTGGTPGPGSHSATYSCIDPNRGPSMKGSERFRVRPDPSPGPGHFLKNYSSFLD